MTRSRIRSLLLVATLVLPANGLCAAEIEGAFHLTGVISSRSGQSALINGRVVQTGERVDGAEVLAIHDSFVVVTLGAKDFVLRIGPHAQKLEKGSEASGISPPSDEPPIHEVVENHESNPPRAPGPTNVHRVEQGETLFEIAGHYFDHGDRRLKQAMLWLYEANPAAFGSSMNLLFEGARLRIPDSEQLRLVSASVARAEVDRHIKIWRQENAPASNLPKIASVNRVSGEATLYGPVTSGETLSAIAERERPEGLSLDQMMLAVFEANPQAFGGHVDMLYAGALLKIPGADAPPNPDRMLEMASGGASVSNTDFTMLFGEIVR